MAGQDGIDGEATAPAPATPATAGAGPSGGAPWMVTPSDGYTAPGDGTRGSDASRVGRLRELAMAGGVLAVMVLLGFPMGWLWSSIAPWTPVQMTGDGPVLAQPEQEQMVADEGWYVFLTIGLGVLAAVLVWSLLRRYRGIAMLLALALGGVGAGVLTWWFGHNIGLSHFRYLTRHAPNGATFGLPVNLRVKQVGMWHGVLPYARGDVLLLAVAATVVYLLLAGFSPHPSLRAGDERATRPPFAILGPYPEMPSPETPSSEMPSPGMPSPGMPSPAGSHGVPPGTVAPQAAPPGTGPERAG